MVELISSPGRLYVHTQMEKTIVDSILVFLWWWAEQRIDNTAGMDGVGMGLILHHKSLGKWVFSFLFTDEQFLFCSLPFSNDRCSWFGENFFQLMYPCSANLTNFPFLKGKPYQFSSCKLQWNYETSSNCFYFPLFLHVMCTCLC